MIRWCEYGHAPVRLTSGQRCPACAKQREARRASPAERGYGSEHRHARSALGAMLPAECGYARVDPKCSQHLITITSRWVAAHIVDGDPSAGWMHAHLDCNERAKLCPK